MMTSTNLCKLDNFSNLDDICLGNSSMAVFDVLMQGRLNNRCVGQIAGNYLTLHVVDGRHHLHYGEVPESN